jgi:hypothetical protein
MDPHTIRVTWVGMVEMLGVGQSCLLGQAIAVDSVVCSMSHLWPVRAGRRKLGRSLLRSSPMEAIKAAHRIIDVMLFAL